MSSVQPAIFNQQFGGSNIAAQKPREQKFFLNQLAENVLLLSGGNWSFKKSEFKNLEL